MLTVPFIEAAHELRGRFYSLVASLSALRELVEVDAKHQPENELVNRALGILLRYQDLARCAVYGLTAGSEGERFEWLAGNDRDDLLTPPDPSPPDPSEDRRRRHPALTDEFLHRVADSPDPVYWSTATGPDSNRAASSSRRSSADPLDGGSLLCTRVPGRAGTLAVACVFHPNPEHFESSHEQLLTLFCGVLGHVLENNRLLRNLEQAVSQRTVQLEAALREAEQLKRRYEQLSNVDELTALHNRRFFFPEAEAALARCVRHRHALSVMLIDLDRFKAINDTFGHAVGDRVLQGVARCLQDQIRDGDIVARYGGEEFVLALPNTDLGGAGLLAQRITAAMSELTWTERGKSLTVTASIGLTDLGERSDTDHPALLEAMLREADDAMYQSKANGRNGASTFGEGPEGPN